MRFIDVVIRQAHPGPEVPAYDTFEQKLHDAERYRREEAIPWPVLVDDLEGTVHQAYGGLADPTYLIDRDGRVVPRPAAVIAELRGGAEARIRALFPGHAPLVEALVLARTDGLEPGIRGRFARAGLCTSGSSPGRSSSSRGSRGPGSGRRAGSRSR